MNEPRIVTEEIVRMVDGYVEKELEDAKRYENSSPLDESGIYSLHRLAAMVYAMGFDAGERVESTREHGKYMRRRDAESTAGEAS